MNKQKKRRSHKVRNPCRYLLFFLTAALLPLLSACGFHLQGLAHSIPPQLHTLYVETNTPYSAFIKNLNARLQQASVDLVSSANEAPITLTIIQTNQSSNALNTDANTASTNVFNLTYTIRYVLKSAAGKAFVQPATVTATDVISLPANTLISNSPLAAETFQQLELQAIQQLLTQLSSTNTIQAIDQLNQQSKPTTEQDTTTNNETQT